MALRFPTHFPLSSSSSSPKPSFHRLKPQLIFTRSTLIRTKSRLTIKAADDDGGLKPTASVDNGNATDSPNDSNQQNTQKTTLAGEDPSKLGEEIRKAMNEREVAAGGGDLWGGVAEEIKQIEWPAFGKVLGTTGAVIGVIAGSSLVLLTLNAILAELSDRVFAGKGVQDFFS